MRNPCYNQETKTDCPRRHSGCAVDCPKWAEYCAERDDEYKQRAEERAIDESLKGNAIARGIYNQRRHIRDRARK